MLFDKTTGRITVPVEEMDPEEVRPWLSREFPCLLEELRAVNTIEDMTWASEKLIEFANVYAYLEALLSHLKIKVRVARREKTKTEQEDMIDRQETVKNMLEATKQKYAAISRAVTIKIENNKEINMSSRQI